jgi:hypothetical protein
MGWGNHHASYDEPITKEYQEFLDREKYEYWESCRDSDYKNIQKYLKLSRDMTQEKADELWYKMYPHWQYIGPFRPPPKRPDRLPPTPVDRPIESPLYWATKGSYHE